MKKIKIVADSASDVISLDGVDFASAPLKIIAGEHEYVDNAELDVDELARSMSQHHGKSSTSCPNIEDWLCAFGDADEIYCVTITGELSGSYQTATMARDIYLEENQDRRVHIINSLSTGPQMGLIIDKLRELILAGEDFEQICKKIDEYRGKTGLLFMLESMKNLANNGRVSHIVASMAGILGIRVIGKASDEGRLEILDKARGENKAIDVIASRLKELCSECGKIKIGYCGSERLGEALKSRIQSVLEKAKIELYRCRGLCTYYTEGGLIVGFEKA